MKPTRQWQGESDVLLAFYAAPSSYFLGSLPPAFLPSFLPSLIHFPLPLAKPLTSPTTSPTDARRDVQWIWKTDESVTSPLPTFPVPSRIPQASQSETVSLGHALCIRSSLFLFDFQFGSNKSDLTGYKLHPSNHCNTYRQVKMLLAVSESWKQGGARPSAGGGAAAAGAESGMGT